MIINQDREMCKVSDNLLGGIELVLKLSSDFLQYIRECKIVMPRKISIEKEY